MSSVKEVPESAKDVGKYTTRPHIDGNVYFDADAVYLELADGTVIEHKAVNIKDGV